MADFQWRETTAPVAGSRYDDIWFINPFVGWACNSDGKILKTTDGGDSWIQQFQVASPFVYPRCLGFVNASKGWLGTTSAAQRLFRTDDGGENWNLVTNLPGGFPAKVCGLSVVNEDVIYASGTNEPTDHAGVLKSTDGGATWSAIDMGQRATLLVDCFFRDENLGWVVGGKADDNVIDPRRRDVKPVVLFTDDGGDSWTDLVVNQRDEFPHGEWGWKIQFVSDTLGFISLENEHAAAILKSTDGGQTWKRIAVDDPQQNKNLEGIGFLDENNGWVGGWGDPFPDVTGKSSETTDGGATWQDANHIGRFINRFRFIGDPLTVGYSCGLTVYKYSTDPIPTAVSAARVAPSDRMLASASPILCEGPAEIAFTLPETAESLSISIWDRHANHKRMLLEANGVNAGAHTVTWDFTDDAGNILPPETYIFRLTADAHTESGMICLSKAIDDNSGGSGQARTGRTAARPGFGLNSFSMHVTEERALSSVLRAMTGSMRRNTTVLESFDSENVARRYLSEFLQSDEFPAVTAARVNGRSCEFVCTVNKRSPLTKLQYVRFRQTYQGVPVHESMVSIELDENRELVSIATSLGDPVNVDPLATVSTAQVRDIVCELAGCGAGSTNIRADLCFYLDRNAERWRLVYIVPHVVKTLPPETAGEVSHEPAVVDFVIDAHSGELVEELPRTAPVAAVALPVTNEESAVDNLGAVRQIRFTRQDGQKLLRDDELNVETYDFGFRPWNVGSRFRPRLNPALPGDLVSNPPTPWNSAAVSAHANTAVVARYLRDVLGRDGLDDRGGAFISTVNAVELASQSNGRVYQNAVRVAGQMIYGQRFVNGELVSFAVSGDVIAHEIFHGVTDTTADLVYQFESGALNESYSDIFGVIISNDEEPDIGNWDWEIGEELGPMALRDLSRPSRFNQPDHMNQFVVLALSQDNGGVHINSGIHNRAAFNLISTQDAAGQFLFTPQQAAALFYLALTQLLGPRSGFTASRRAVELVGRSLFRNAPDMQTRVNAIGAAYDAVGIDS